MSTLIGWLGSICLATCGIPQAYCCVKQGHSKDLSRWFLSLWFAGEVCYVVTILLQFGWVGWMMFNYCLNIACILVIGWYYFRPRQR